MKTCKSFREFLKINRKYSKRVFYKFNDWKDREGKWHPAKSVYKPFIVIWVHYIIDSAEKIAEVQRHKKYYKGNLKLIVDSLARDLHSKVYVREYDRILKKWVDRKVTLSGIEITNEDYYFMYTREDGSHGYESCVGGYKLAEEELLI